VREKRKYLAYQQHIKTRHTTRKHAREEKNLKNKKFGIVLAYL
jgi:hypothetical protein